jgi:cell fate (sporulation/competence/biofilm development) regulator YmcA (YheA/YmcA/DUF963 family)
MIENKIDDLFKAIENSKEYQDYLKIGETLSKDNSINELIEEIKKLQKKSTMLEYNNDDSYKEVDKEIEKKVQQLNEIPAYREYLNKMNEFNDILAMSSKMLEDYVEESSE